MKLQIVKHTLCFILLCYLFTNDFIDLLFLQNVPNHWLNETREKPGVSLNPMQLISTNRLWLLL